MTLQIHTEAVAVHGVCVRTPGPLCLAAGNDFAGHFSLGNFLIYDSLLVLPALAGIFIGAPLMAREFEQGTARLIWTQGITPVRWLVTKVNFVVVVASVLSGVIAFATVQMVGVQREAFTSRWSSFDIQGVPFVAYVVFAIALGVAVGSLARRVLPAMVITLAVFVAARLAVVLWIRPNLLRPLEWDASRPMTDSGDVWTVGQRAVDLTGNSISEEYYHQVMASSGAMLGSSGEYLRAHGVVLLQLYQPESRFWLFQNLEGTLFLAAAAVLFGLAVLSTRRT
jgi:hypothetical protein